MALSADQINALTTQQQSYLPIGSPIVLDLNGDGISTQSIASGVQFDIYGVNHLVATGWVSGGDGLLVMDRNHDGTVNGGTELFGQGTNLASGAKAVNGYQALSELDANHDGVINAGDSSFAELMVWVDSNSDGVSQSGELQSLQQLGISQLDLSAQKVTELDHGNIIGLVSGYTTTDGATHAMADVWFTTSLSAKAVGTVAEGGSNATTAMEPTGTGVLQAQVSDLVESLGRFEQSVLPSSGMPSTQGALRSPHSESVLADLGQGLRQFDANGRIVDVCQRGQVVPHPAKAVGLALGQPRDDLLAPSK
jgi:hypothetical protein